MKKDIHNFTRKLRLTEYFANENDITFDEQTEPLVKNRGTFHPPRNQNKMLDIVVDFDNAATKNKPNISKNEWQAIKSLKENDSIAIKEADKDGAVVVMNKIHYYNIVAKIFQDEETYKKTNENCDKKVFKDLEKLVAKFSNCLLKEEQDFLTKFSFSTSNFYGLPKIHKSKIIQGATQVQSSEYVKIYEPPDLTLRPIVAGPNCPTRRLSNLVDILLKPFLIYIKSYIKDNLDFLAKCSRENRWNTILTTFDAVGLYSNIPHEYGLEAIGYWLDKFPESLHRRFPKEFVLESVKFILENNNLNFDNEYFNQIKGTAMGAIFAPTYANLTMGFFELTFYDLCKDRFGEDLGDFIFENWSRFLDDCETLLEENKINPNDLLSILN